MSSPSFDIAIPRGAYPEKYEPPLGTADRWAQRGLNPVTRRWRARQVRDQRLVRRVNDLATWAAELSDTDIADQARALRPQLRRRGFVDDLVVRVFALVREIAGRKLKGKRHYDVQVRGGLILLQGMVAEMETGEGKTLTATLPACAVALAGIPVHVITVNDYLAQRDAEEMGSIYRALGLSVGVITHDKDPDARRSAYRADITYCTNKELAFDYLRDRIALGREASYPQLLVERLHGRSPRMDDLLLRGLYYGIVDEADSVLVDEAKTPLIISGGKGDESERAMYELAFARSAELRAGEDFVIEARQGAVRLTPKGSALLADGAVDHGIIWARRQWREELVRQALAARYLKLKDKHYLVKDDKVQIVDESTGRIMEGRSWEHGLHQLVEVKENCPPTQRIDPLARISYQRFFRRYLRLAGMTGTAQEVAGELWAVYRLATVRVPTHRPVQRRGRPVQVFSTRTAKWQTVIERIVELHRSGRPVLVGTRTVAASEELSGLLKGRGIEHQVLNARQDRLEEEAAIVALAGQLGMVTVATNMAGRGTDIKLGPGVKELGGLCVIATELHEARRIDRQLFGRCGRQGDPGSYEALVSLEDDLVKEHAPRWCSQLLTAGAKRGEQYFQRAAVATVKLAQRRADRLNLRARRDLMKHDEQMESALSFAGKGE